jgi:dipeptidyl aminopeptidase/acylaminoacyl peptidase
VVSWLTNNNLAQSPTSTKENVSTLAAQTVWAMLTQTAINIPVNEQDTNPPTLVAASPAPPVITPIKGKIVYLSGTDAQQDLLVLNTEDNTTLNITNNPRNIVGNDQDFFSTCFLNTNPIDISFDGTRIAYVVDINPDFNSSSDQVVSLSDVVSGQSQDISQSTQAYCNLAWSPDGNRLAFTSAGAPLGNKLFIADQSGQVLDDIPLPDTYIGNLYWINSDEISLTMDQPQKLYQIFIDSNAQLSMQEFPLPVNTNWVSVSPTGKYLAIQEEQGITRLADLNGNKVSDLGTSYLGRWSKSGRLIVNFIPDVDFDWLGYTNLLVGSTETPDVVTISPPLQGHYKIQSVFWSPTEEYVAMMVCENHSGNIDTGFKKYPPCDIYLSTLTGETWIIPSTRGNYYINSDRQVAWSPDGARIALVFSDGDEPSHLRIYDIASDELIDMGETSPNTPIFWVP